MRLSLVLWRVASFALLWIVLVEGDPAYFWYAVLAVPVAVAASVAWLPPARPTRSAGPKPPHTRSEVTASTSGSARTPLLRPMQRARAAVTLVFWLLWQSVRGGVDVAARAISTPVRVDPVEVVVPVHLTGAARAVSLAVLGLMPGTIVSEVREHEAVVHTVSADLDAAQTWRDLETRVLSVVGGAGGEPTRSRDAQ